MSKIPTFTQFENAENYALKKMCEEGVPNRYGVYSYLKWDNQKKKCMITSQGCEPGYNNPFNQNPLTASGEVITDYSNITTSSFNDIWKYAPPEFYLNKVTKNSGGMQVCARGTPQVYQWCQEPQTRGEKPGEVIPGVTNQKPFKHTVVRGKETCLIGSDYCADHAYDYDATNFECVEPVGLQVADFFGIKTFVQNLTVRGVSENDILAVAIARRIQRAASDSRLKENIRIHTKDYVRPGINLYTFRWKSWAMELYGKYGNDIGFIADELPKEWTSVDSHGYLNINLDSKDPGMKKIRDFFVNKR